VPASTRRHFDLMHSLFKAPRELPTVLAGSRGDLTEDASALRTFLRDVLAFAPVDAGGGWLIFALPPTELAAHTTEDGGHHELYLMCDHIHATVAEVTEKGVEFAHPGSRGGIRPIDSDRPAGWRRAQPVRASTSEPAH
jgi:hypothetical protein